MGGTHAKAVRCESGDLAEAYAACAELPQQSIMNGLTHQHGKQVAAYAKKKNRVGQRGDLAGGHAARVTLTDSSNLPGLGSFLSLS